MSSTIARYSAVEVIEMHGVVGIITCALRDGEVCVLEAIIKAQNIGSICKICNGICIREGTTSIPPRVAQ